MTTNNRVLKSIIELSPGVFRLYIKKKRILSHIEWEVGLSFANKVGSILSNWIENLKQTKFEGEFSEIKTITYVNI